MGKYVFENAISAPLMDCHDLRGTKYTVFLSIMLNSSFNTFYGKEKDDKINSLLTCLRRVHFRGMAAGFLCGRWIFIILHSSVCYTSFEN